MRILLLIFLAIPLISFQLPRNEYTIVGTWELNQVTLNGDTIFNRGNFDYTLNHNFESNKKWISTREDSSVVYDQAKANFEKFKNLRIEFLIDSTFKMTKVRSGGGVNLEEMDFGTYELKNDTLRMTNHSRRDYKMMFIVDLKNEIIFQKDGVPNHMVFQEYKKKN